jgi:hypothetical protein
LRIADCGLRIETLPEFLSSIFTLRIADSPQWREGREEEFNTDERGSEQIYTDFQP